MPNCGQIWGCSEDWLSISILITNFEFTMSPADGDIYNNVDVCKVCTWRDWSISSHSSQWRDWFSALGKIEHRHRKIHIIILKNGIIITKLLSIYGMRTFQCVDCWGMDCHFPRSYTWHATPYHKWVGKCYCFLHSVIFIHFISMAPDKSSSIISLSNRFVNFAFIQGRRSLSFQVFGVNKYRFYLKKTG